MGYFMPPFPYWLDGSWRPLLENMYLRENVPEKASRRAKAVVERYKLGGM